MKLRQLQALQAIAETGSFQSAAEQLSITQPAVSRAIADLESELGAALLTRLAKGAALTDFGNEVLKRAQAIDREVARIKDSAKERRGAAGGRLVVANSGAAGTTAFANAVIAFHEQHPQIQVSVIELRRQQIIAGLRDRAIDVGVFGAYDHIGSSPHFSVEPLYGVNIHLAVSSRCTLPARVSLSQLADMTWLTLDALDDPSSLINRIFAPHGLPAPRRAIRCTSLFLYCELARRLDVVSIWSEPAQWLLQVGLDKGSMKTLMVEEGLPSSVMYLAHSEQQLLSVAAREFIAWFRSKLQQAGGPPAMVRIA
jgi:LysR family transcriptional regulator of abg operon